MFNGIRYECYKIFEHPAESRHNCRQLTRWPDYLALNEIGSGNDLIVRAVDRPADELDFVTRLTGSLAHHFLQFADFGFDNRQRLREVHRGGREMAGYCIELFGYQFPLDRNLSSLLAYIGHSL